jgi:hypothetical protein
MKTFIKKFGRAFWAGKTTIAMAWLFFFLTSLFSKSPNTIFTNFLISGAFSISMCSLMIILILTGIYPTQYNGKDR